MAAKVLVLYRPPVDSDAFDRYFRSTHVPLAKAVPDVRSIDIARGEILDPQGPSSYAQVTTLTFDSMDDLRGAMSSGEGEAVLEDITNFATGGATVLMFETEQV